MRISKLVSGILFSFTVVLICLSLSPFWDDLLAGREMPIFIDYLIDAGFISAFSLWLWMFGNFFQSGPRKARIYIGVMLLFFNLVAAPIYWATYYVRR
jgi:hypothetical protein